ncbi:metal-sensitive transcriptional regulator [Anaerotalea alkaliphila]|uniref:metal-sensitive transcriptional regulator n=1 Tax=Anaerotalea alkaliphila TaxID=2662126 RepID=UPI0031B637E3
MENENDAILKRLRRIEGQVKGIIRMVEEESTCDQILTQVSAVRAATNKVGGLILERYYEKRLGEVEAGVNPAQTFQELIATTQKFLGFLQEVEGARHE